MFLYQSVSILNNIYLLIPSIIIQHYRVLFTLFLFVTFFYNKKLSPSLFILFNSSNNNSVYVNNKGKIVKRRQTSCISSGQFF